MSWVLARMGLTGQIAKATAVSLMILTSAAAAGLFWWLGTTNQPLITPRTTRLRLQFNIGNEQPEPVEKENIWHWYTVPIALDGADKSGRVIARLGRPWLIYIEFDKPIAPKYFRITGGGAKLPPHEVKDFTSRHAIIAFVDDLSGLGSSLSTSSIRSRGSSLERGRLPQASRDARETKWLSNEPLQRTGFAGR
jgi:hypothetical protein